MHCRQLFQNMAVSSKIITNNCGARVGKDGGPETEISVLLGILQALPTSWPPIILIDIILRRDGPQASGLSKVLADHGDSGSSELRDWCWLLTSPLT